MSSPPTISKQRAQWFKITAILLPFLLLFTLEGVLRLVSYGKDYPLFVADANSPTSWVMNPEVSEKYFSNNANATIGYQEPFPMEKGTNTFRIFVLGASTAVGYPYLHNGSFHRHLQHRLNRTFPDKTIEVTNLALTAVNSYTVLDFAEQLVDYQPDAVLIYAGHNEYYGALGVGSTTAIGSSPALVRLMLQLRELRVVQLLTNTLHLFKPTASPSDLQENLMKRMTAEQSIAYNSDLYQKGIQQYKANLTAALSILDEHEIPTFISTLVSNEKDLTPFVSDSIQEESSANYFYQLGQKAYQQADFSVAKQHFIKAKELDMLRFRAPEAMNDVIRELTKQFLQVYLVDARAHLESSIPHRIVGNEVLLEHVHPNQLGYSLIADAFYQRLRKENIIDADWELASDWKTAYQAMPITEVDSLKGAYEIMILKEGWPFYEPITDLDTANRSLPEAIAGALAVQQISWEEAMERLYQHYYQNKNYPEALKVAEAITLEHPHEAQFFTKAAGLALQLNDITKASYLFQRALTLEKSAVLARKIAINFIKADALEAALPYLQYITKQESGDMMSFRLISAIKSVQSLSERRSSVTDDAKTLIRLAENYLLLGKQDIAKEYLESVLNQDSTNPQALKLMKKIQN